MERTVRTLKEQPGSGLHVGVTLPLALAALGLIDEYELVVHLGWLAAGRRRLQGRRSLLTCNLRAGRDSIPMLVVLLYESRKQSSASGNRTAGRGSVSV
jgi:hypothetical protein